MPVSKRGDIIKKRTKKFVRFHSNRFMRVKPAWRKPRGIDNRARRRYRGTNLMPNIGYGSNKRTKYLLPNHKYKFTVHNIKELEPLIMHNKKFCVELGKNVSARKRTSIIKRAMQLHIRVINSRAKLKRFVE